MNIKRIIREEVGKLYTMNESEDLDWITDVKPSHSKVIVNFPKDKYTLEDSIAFLDYMVKNHPLVQPFSSRTIDPRDYDYNYGSEGIRYWIEPFGEQGGDDYDYQIAWSDMDYGEEGEDIGEFLQLDWNEFQRANLQFLDEQTDLTPVEMTLTESNDFDWIEDVSASDGSQPIVGNIYFIEGIRRQSGVHIHVQITDVTDTMVYWEVISVEVPGHDDDEEDTEVGEKDSFVKSQFYHVIKPGGVTKAYGDDVPWWEFVGVGDVRINESGLDWIDKVEVPALKGDWYIDVFLLSRDDKRKVQEYLLGLGHPWKVGGHVKENLTGYNVAGYMVIDGWLYWTPDSYEERGEKFDSNKEDSPHYLRYVNGLELLNQNISESQDFEWIEDTRGGVTLDGVNDYVIRLSDDVGQNLKEQAAYIKLLGIPWQHNARAYAKEIVEVGGVDVIKRCYDTKWPPIAMYYYLDDGRGRKKYSLGYFSIESEMDTYLKNVEQPIFI